MSIKKLVDTAKSISDMAPQAYSDIVQPSAQNVGKTLSTVTELLNTLLTPIELLNKTVSIKKEQFLSEYKSNIDSIPKEKFCQANFAIIAPMIEHLKYKITEDELRLKYAKLISEVSNSDSLTKPLLSFDNVLDQLSPYEIELLTLLFAENPYGNYPLASIKKTSQLGYNILYKNMANISFKNFTFDVISIMISNLERVGIIFIDYFQFVEPAKEYDYIQNSDLYIKIKTECEHERNTTNLKYPNCIIDKHMFCLTEFGVSFVQTIIT